MPLTRNQSNAASQAKFNSTDNSETGTSKENGEQGGTSGESEPPRRDSPENCSICLGPFNNKSFTSSCAHSFCFVCLKQWSKVKAECPLCKQPFTSIFHNIRSNQHYDIYELPQQPSNMYDIQLYDFVGGSIPTFPGPTHHLLSLPQPTFDADLTLSNFSRFQFRHRRYDRYLNPLSIHGEHPYSFTGPVINPSSHISASTWPRGAEDFRREVYRRNMGPPAVIVGHENFNYRLTPAMVAASAHRIQRIMPWLTRELRVLLRSHQNVRLAISVIQPLLSQVNIDSVYFFDRIVPLIGHRSRQFVQQFVAFANSALNVQAFDRKAMYRRSESAQTAPSSSSSPSSENDVVEVTDVSPDIHPSAGAPGPSQTQSLNLLSRIGWRSPTPGPSWSNSDLNVASQTSIVDRVSVSSESEDPVYRPDCHGSDSDESRAGSDIIFVKYDKPWNERSPIQLTSDSEGKGESELPRKKKKSKHKKKKKEPTDEISDAATSKKDKSRRTKHRNKSKGSSKAASDEERESVSFHKRRHSQSPDQHKLKKHKKSKRKEKLSDREIVDRYFAEAMTQNEKQTPLAATDGKDGDTLNKKKDKEKSGNGSSKERSRKKKKSRKHSKDSHNQSFAHTYKKHPSGHKKSSNRLADNLPESLSRHNRQSPIRGDPPGTQGRSSRHETTASYNTMRQEASSSPLPHSVVPGFQPPYLSMTDTVQHIPVNLWVSTWPALSVSHTYPPPPSSLPNGQTPQTSNAATALSSNPSGAGPSRLYSVSISSNSSSDSTESESDDAQDLHIPSLQNVHSRTKQWLETNFPDLGRPQASSVSAPTSSSTASSSSANENPSRACEKSTEDDVADKNSEQEDINEEQFELCHKENEMDVEVVSIPSGEEVLVCSSDDDLMVMDYVQPNKQNDTHRKETHSSRDASLEKKGEASSSGNISTLPFPGDPKKMPSTGKTGLILPPVNQSFQPFRLQKKPALSRGKDPFLFPMIHSSDEDGEVNHILQDKVSSSFASSFFTAEGKDGPSFASTSSRIEEKKNALNFVAASNSIMHSTSSLSNSLDVNDLLSNKERGFESSTCNENSSGHTQKNTLATSNTATSATLSTTTSSVFSMLPPLTSSNPSTSVMSSGISYLPYSNLTPTSSAASLLPCYVPPAIRPSLPLHFPFPQYPSLLTSSSQSSSIVPSLYPSGNESSPSKAKEQASATRISSNSHIQSKGDSSCFSSELKETIIVGGCDSYETQNCSITDNGKDRLLQMFSEDESEQYSLTRTVSNSNEHNTSDIVFADSNILQQSKPSNQSQRVNSPPFYKELPAPNYSQFETIPPFQKDNKKLRTKPLIMKGPEGDGTVEVAMESAGDDTSLAKNFVSKNNEDNGDSGRLSGKYSVTMLSMLQKISTSETVSDTERGEVGEHCTTNEAMHSTDFSSADVQPLQQKREELRSDAFSQYIGRPPFQTEESKANTFATSNRCKTNMTGDSESSFQDSNYYWSDFGKCSSTSSMNSSAASNKVPSNNFSPGFNTDSNPKTNSFKYTDSLSNLPLQEAIDPLSTPQSSLSYQLETQNAASDLPSGSSGTSGHKPHLVEDFTACKSAAGSGKSVLPYTDFLASSCESNTGSDTDS